MIARRRPFWGRKRAKKFCNPILRNHKIFGVIKVFLQEKTQYLSRFPEFSTFFHVEK